MEFLDLIQSGFHAPQPANISPKRAWLDWTDGNKTHPNSGPWFFFGRADFREMDDCISLTRKQNLTKWRWRCGRVSSISPLTNDADFDRASRAYTTLLICKFRSFVWMAAIRCNGRTWLILGRAIGIKNCRFFSLIKCEPELAKKKHKNIFYYSSL